jgi:protein-L-isoaspartate O-methyltransferase
MVAMMTDLFQLKPDDLVLAVGSAIDGAVFSGS